MVKIVSKVWAAIEEALDKNGKSATWLAQELGVSDNAVSKWRKGGPVSRGNAEKISILLGIPLDKLLLGKENPMTAVLEMLPIERSRMILDQIRYQIDRSADVLGPKHMASYTKMVDDFQKDIEKRKGDEKKS